MTIPCGEWHGTSSMISQHWFRWWLGAVRQQAITWANVDLAPCHHMASPGHNLMMLWWDPNVLIKLGLIHYKYHLSRYRDSPYGLIHYKYHLSRCRVSPYGLIHYKYHISRYRDSPYGLIHYKYHLSRYRDSPYGLIHYKYHLSRYRDSIYKDNMHGCETIWSLWWESLYW